MTIPPLTDHICFSIYAAQQAINRIYQPLLEGVGLTYPQYVTMVTLWEEDGVTVGHIGNRLGLETNTLTPLLKRLEAAGLVTRKRDRKDERRVLITLTDQGRDLKARANHIPGCFLSASGLSGAEAKALQGWVDELRVTLGKAQSAKAS